MSLNDIYWENYLENVKNKIPEAINNNMIGKELQEELLELYRLLDDNNISITEKKQRAKLVEHYLEMCREIINNEPKRR